MNNSIFGVSFPVIGWESTDVSEEHIVSIFRVEEWAKQVARRALFMCFIYFTFINISEMSCLFNCEQHISFSIFRSELSDIRINCNRITEGLLCNGHWNVGPGRMPSVKCTCPATPAYISKHKASHVHRYGSWSTRILLPLHEDIWILDSWRILRHCFSTSGTR
jgi:hypothetical protein